VAVDILSFLYYGYIVTGDFYKSRNVQANWGRTSTLNIFEPIVRETTAFIDSTVIIKSCGYHADCYFRASYTLISCYLFILLFVYMIWKTKKKCDRFSPAFFISFYVYFTSHQQYYR
jgi:hypothetical protein